jgi:hypothetical protein
MRSIRSTLVALYIVVVAHADTNNGLEAKASPPYPQALNIFQDISNKEVSHVIASISTNLNFVVHYA